MTTKALLPCPFCGKPACREDAQNVRCTHCDAWLSAHNATEQWNTRTALSAPDQAEPVAWRVRIGDSDLWGYCENEWDADFRGKQSGLRYVKEPLYIATPSPSKANPTDWISLVCRDISELPDRDSPEGWPEALIVEPEELRDIIYRHAPPSPQAAELLGEVVEWAFFMDRSDGKGRWCNGVVEDAAMPEDLTERLTAFFDQEAARKFLAGQAVPGGFAAGFERCKALAGKICESHLGGDHQALLAELRALQPGEADHG